MTDPDAIPTLTDRARSLLAHLKTKGFGAAHQVTTPSKLLSAVSRRRWPNVGTVEEDLDILVALRYLTSETPKSTGGRPPRRLYRPTGKLYREELPPPPSTEPRTTAPPPDPSIPLCGRCGQPKTPLVVPPATGRGRWCLPCMTEFATKH